MNKLKDICNSCQKCCSCVTWLPFLQISNKFKISGNNYIQNYEILFEDVMDLQLYYR
jgi:hypothetical protein